MTVLAPTTEYDLHTTGPRHFEGELASDGSVEALVVKLNHGDQTANYLLTLFKTAKRKKQGRREHMVKNALM